MFKYTAIKIRITHQTINTMRETKTLDGREVKLNWQSETVLHTKTHETPDPLLIETQTESENVPWADTQFTNLTQ